MQVGPAREVPPTKCIECEHPFDLASVAGTSEAMLPKSGDFSICIECGHLAVFTDDLQLREPNDAEIKSVAGDKRLLEVQWARGEVRQKLKIQTQEKK